MNRLLTVKFYSEEALSEMFNFLMHNVPKWSDTFKNLTASTARFLKCV